VSRIDGSHISFTAPAHAAGAVNIVVNDKNNNAATQSPVQFTYVCATITSSITKTSYNGSDLSCSNSSDGKITITGGGGTAPLQYSKDNGTNFQAGNIFSGLPAGSYNVVVKDANGCTSSATPVTLTAPAAVTIGSAIKTSYNGSDLSCATSSDGKITVTASGGSGTLQYSKDNGSTFQSGNIFSSLPAGSYNIVVKDANSCTSAATPVTITAPAAVSIGSAIKTSYNGSDLSCATATDGKITVTASGGSGTLQYSKDNGSTFQSGNIFSSLPAGSYNIVVKDANGCTSSATPVTLAAPPTVTIGSAIKTNYNGSDLSCSTASDGKITVTASGGTGTLQYSDNNGSTFQAGNIFSSLPAGSYNIVVKDANGCTSSATPVTLAAPPTVTIGSAIKTNYNGSDLSCSTASDGKITVTASGGTGTLQYSDNNGSTFQAGNIFSSLPAGSYNIVVKDANGCMSPATSVTITAPSAVTIGSAIKTSYNGSDLSCSTASDGKVTVTASGGSGTLQYSKDNGSTFQSGNIFSSLPAGSYNIVVKDANGCTSVATPVTITAPSAVTIGSAIKTSYNGSDLSCATATDGKITITGSGGTGTLQYSDDNGSTFQAGNIFSSLPAGSYNIVVKDANGCTSAATPVTITAPAAVTIGSAIKISYNGSDLSCSTASDGKITVTASGGTGTLQYSDNNGSTFQAGNIFSSLSAGNYNIIVKDANSCTSAATPITLTAPPAVTIGGAIKTSYNGSDLSCATSTDGKITVTAIGGTGTLTYSDDNGTTFQAGNVFSSLPAGNYNIVVKDANGCVSPATPVTITAPAAVTIGSAIKTSYNGSDLSCATSTDGKITVTASGGSGTLQYSKDNGSTFQAGSIFSSLPAGSYNIVVKDANGCTSSATAITLTAPAAITIGSAIKTSYNGSDLSCATATDGKITVTASGGTGTLTYSDDNGSTFQAGNIFSSLPAGSYNIVVKDANGCNSAATSVTLTAPSAVTIGNAIKTSYNGSDLSCATASDGKITVTASGGTGTLTYSDDNGTSFQAGNIFSSLPAGSYNIIVKDANGCTSSATPITITAPAAVTIGSAIKTSYNGSDLSCATATDGKITVTASGGTGTLQYSKDNGTSFQAGNIFSGLPAGSYNIVVKDANGCMSPATPVTITAPSAVTIGSAIKTSYNGSDLSCATSTDGKITITASGGTGTLTYSDDNGTTFQAGNIFSDLPAGSYNIVVKDANGCTSASTAVTITAPAAITIGSAIKTSYNGSDLSCATATDGKITVTASGGTGTLTYSDDNGSTFQAGNIFSSLPAGSYNIVVKDANGCTSAATSVTLTAPSAVTIGSAIKTSYNGSDLSCATSTDGKITVTASGGTGTLMYSDDNGSTFQAGSIFSGLPAGSYNIVVKDANGCMSPATPITITAPSVVTIGSAIKTSYNGSDLSCATATDGKITITASGGTGTLSYSDDNGTTFQAGNVFSSLPAGNYNIVVKDANNCVSAPTAITITAPAAVTIGSALKTSYNGSDLSCAAATDGKITVTASGGTGTLMYSDDNGATFQAGNIFSSLPAGSYNVVVKDANGCMSPATTVTLTAPAAVTIGSAIKTSYNGADLSCATATDGKITVTASGGTGTLQYSDDNGATFQASNIFSSLPAGSYNIVVKDANNCTSAPTAITLTAPSAVTIGSAIKTSYNGSDLSCATATDGKITVTASGGTGTLTYSDDNGSTFQAGNTFSSLPAGSYNIVVKDANGCTSAATPVTITAPTAITIGSALKTSYNGADLSCATTTDGKITVTASGGTGTLTYSDDNGATFQAGNIFSSLPAGSYNIVVKDANGCTSAATPVTLTAPAAVTIGSAIKTSYNGSDLSCATATDGKITVTASGGTGTLQYSDDNGSTFQAGNIFSSLPAGSYNIVVKDANGCTSAATPVTITAPAAVSIGSAIKTSYNGSDLSCSTASDGKITVTASGGTGTLMYSDDNGATFQAGNIFSSLPASSYNIVVKDANGCMSPATSVTITAPSAVSIGSAVKTSYNGSDLSCATSTDGKITVTASGGTGTLTYSDDNGTTFQAGNIFSSLPAGSYNIVVKDANGCTSSATAITLTAPAAVTIGSATKTSYNGSDLSCATASDGKITVTASGGTGTLQYSDNNGSTFQAGNIFSSLPAGSYNIVVKDANGCMSPATPVTLTAPSAVTIGSAIKTSYNGSDLSCATASDGKITVTATGGTGTLQYSKDNGSTFQAGNIFSSLPAGSYNIVVKDANGCTSSATAITLTAPSAVTIGSATKTSYNGADLSCATSSDGKITVTASGGSGTLTYSKDNGSTFQAGNVLSSLPAGSYNIVVKDANNCTSAPTAITLTAPSAVTIGSAIKTSYNGSDLSCPTASDGKITVTASGGIGTLQYSDNNGSTYQAGNIFSSLSAGSYNIVVKDANGCTSAATTVTLTAPAAVTIGSAIKTSYNGSDLSCATASDGKITVTATGGTGALQYSKDNGSTYQAGNIFSGLPAGSYKIVARDANGCTSPATTITITAPATLIANCSNNNAQLFYGYTGDQTSTITVTPSGGVGPYKVSISMNRPILCNQINDAGDESWVGGSGGTTLNNSCPANPALATQLPSTTKTISAGSSYSVTVTLMANAVFTATITDANGCTATCTTTILAEDVRCFAGNSGVSKIAMCHKTGSDKNPCVSICIDSSAIQEHLSHGDFFGKCTPNCQPPYTSTVINPAAINSLSNTLGDITTNMQGLTAQVVPNPTETYFTLHLQSSSMETIFVKIFDMSGRQVETLRETSSGTFQFGSKLTPGMYIVQITQGDHVKVLRVIKI